jgi:hypothetical protein
VIAIDFLAIQEPLGRLRGVARLEHADDNAREGPDGLKVVSM